MRRLRVVVTCRSCASRTRWRRRRWRAACRRACPRWCRCCAARSGNSQSLGFPRLVPMWRAASRRARPRCCRCCVAPVGSFLSLGFLRPVPLQTWLKRCASWPRFAYAQLLPGLHVEQDCANLARACSVTENVLMLHMLLELSASCGDMTRLHQCEADNASGDVGFRAH